jgi:signal transduction histidine kinase
MRLPWPDTLVGRTALVLIVGLILSQVAGILVFSANRFQLESRLFGSHVADRIAGAVRLIEATPAVERPQVLRAIDVPGLHVGWGAKPLVEENDTSTESTDVLAALDRRLTGYTIHTSTARPPEVIATSQPPPGAGMLRNIMARGTHPLLRVAVQLRDQTWLNFLAPDRPPEPLWRPGFYAPLLVGVLVVVVLSVLAMGYAARPLHVLAAAAQRLGRDVSAPPVPEAGPREVRAAARAFNEMQSSLRRFVEDRTQMIAAISHDLRTPITRLKLRAEFVDDDEQRTKMLADLDEMETMIAATLSFARDDMAREPRAAVDLAEMIAGLAADFGAIYSGPERLIVQAAPTALKRAFANLLENAQAYAGEARVTVVGGHPSILVTIDDDGPGIPAADLERVFAPFYRVEGSRNRDTGGTGLGLAVARSALRAHGGDVQLENRTAGGLRVTVTLPA